MAQQTSMFYSWKCSLKLYWWSYVFPWKSALLQDSCQLYYGLGWLKLSQCYLKMHVVGEGPGAILWVLRHFLSLIQFSPVAQSCPTLCDPMDCSMPGLPVHHQHLEFTQTHVHWVGVPIQPSHLLSFPSPPALNLSQHKGLFKWVSSLH